MHSIYKVPYYQVIILPLLVKFLPLLIHLSLTYEISRLLLPLLNLALAETWPKETKGFLLFLMQLSISFNHWSHYNNISQRLCEAN